MNNKEINELIFCLGKVTLEIYDRGYLQAYRDFVKQEKTKECETNE